MDTFKEAQAALKKSVGEIFCASPKASIATPAGAETHSRPAQARNIPPPKKEKVKKGAADPKDGSESENEDKSKTGFLSSQEGSEPGPASAHEGLGAMVQATNAGIEALAAQDRQDTGEHPKHATCEDIFGAPARPALPASPAARAAADERADRPQCARVRFRNGGEARGGVHVPHAQRAACGRSKQTPAAEIRHGGRWC